MATRDFTDYRFLLIECEVWQQEKSKPAALLKRNAQERAERVRNFIESIPDQYTKQIFVLRCYDGLEWETVTDKIGALTSCSIKQIFHRYLKAHAA